MTGTGTGNGTGTSPEARLSADAGTTLVELLVSLLAGSIVLAAAAALFVPTMQNADRAGRSAQNLSVATTTSSLLQRQVLGATSVVVSNSGKTLTLCTFPTATAGTRSVVTWTISPNAAGTGVLVRGGTTLFGDQSTFATGTTFGADTTVAANAVLTATLVTSRATGSGAAIGAPPTVLTVSASPRSQQNGSCS